MLQRPITSGSRQAPDPFDQFLESRFLYRKHTARDASCLFRVIAEQMYDTQTLHYEVRLECVRFMTLKRRIFEKHIDGDFDAYMLDMSKPKTYGTMLELRAMCCMYRRNVVLFEPFNLGSLVTFNSRFNDTFRVFYTNECHFDSIFVLRYIETAAVCQSVSFNVLYKLLYKLPDVGFAVEAMLHPHSFAWGDCGVEFDENGYILRLICRDGRVFKLDKPDNTKCILENCKLCNFHSSPKQAQALLPMTGYGKKRELTRELEKLPHSADSKDLMLMCPNRLTSCVRQLLDDGITPFPYKVAKSLDPYMYRNIEFDCWNDLRKEAKRFNSYAGDYNFKVGAKCRVELDYFDGNLHMHTCHIQKIARDKSYCVVYVEHVGEKLMVPYESLHPLPPDEFRPWTLPFRYQRQLQKLQLSKFVHKTKLNKWKKAKLFDMDTYFEASKCENMDKLLYSFTATTGVNCLEYPNFAGDHAHCNGHGQRANSLAPRELLPKSDTEKAAQNQANNMRDNQKNASKPTAQHQQLPTAAVAPATQEQQQQSSPLPAPLPIHVPPLDMEERTRILRIQEAALLMAPTYQANNVPAGQYGNYFPLLVGNTYPALATAGALPPWHANHPAALPPPVGLADDLHNVYSQAPPALGEPLHNSGMFVPFGYPAAPPAMNMLPLPNPMDPAFLPSPQFTSTPTMRAALPVPPNSPVMPQANNNNRQQPDNSRQGAINQLLPKSPVEGGESNESVEVRRSFRDNGDDLPDDVTMLRYFYNMGVDMHMRLSQQQAVEKCGEPVIARQAPVELRGRNMPSLEELRSLGLMPVDYDTPVAHTHNVGDKNAADAKQLLCHHSEQHDRSMPTLSGHKASVDEAAALMVNTTPPPTPDVQTAELAIANKKLGNSYEHANNNNNNNKQQRNNNNNGSNNKRTYSKQQRGKRHDSNNNNKAAANVNGNFHFDFKDIMAHTMLLPTPTSSPTANNGAQFTFFPSAQATPASMPLLQPPPSVYFTREAAAAGAAQNPFAWSMSPQAPPLGMPMELHAANFMNHMESLAANQKHAHLPPLTATQLPQPIYTAGRL